MMRWLEETIKRTEKNEGFRSKVYQDHKDVDTIGHGFKLSDFELPEPFSVIILRLKIYEFTLRIYQIFPWFTYMPAPVKSVIVEMCYQMGINGFSKFEKTIKYFINEEWLAASKEMLDSELGRDPMTRKRTKQLSKIVAGVSNG